MSVKETARKQYGRILDRTARQCADLGKPPDGWLALLRKALGMSGAEVAARLGLSRNAIYQAERNERAGAITLNQMQKLAEAMGGRFVYAIVPEGSVEEVIRAQAHRKAEARVRLASAHMALEDQALPSERVRDKIDELSDMLVRDPPSDFWKDQ